MELKGVDEGVGQKIKAEGFLYQAHFVKLRSKGAGVFVFCPLRRTGSGSEPCPELLRIYRR
jgi:hypothetical protein